VSSAWLDEQRVLDRNLEVHEVNSHVLLGDNRTRIKITEAVNLRLKFIRDNGKEVIADVLCYVIPHSPNTTPIILGVPAILSASLFDYFLEILREGFRLIGHSERSSKARAENYMSSLQNIKEELIPWPSVRDPLSPEELETDMPDSFSDCLSFLTTTRLISRKLRKKFRRKSIFGGIPTASASTMSEHPRSSAELSLSRSARYPAQSQKTSS
jgi:hypothetical protein